jgi:NitT/TauT family transport system substrate-binding protein
VRRLETAALVGVFSLVLAACGSEDPANTADGGGAGAGGGSAPEMTKLTMAVGATTANTIPYWVCQTEGICEDHGIELEMVTMPGAQSRTALASGSVQIVSTGVVDMAGAIVAGNPMQIVGVTYPYPFFWLVGQKELEGPEDLEGKTVAVSTPGASSDAALALAMEPTGLVRGEDYEVVFVGDNPARRAALEQGVVDAIITAPPSANELEAQGFSVLVDLIEEKAPYGYSSIGIDTDWAEDEANQEVLANFLAAYIESVAFAKDNPDVAYELMRKELNLTDQTLMEEVYDLAVGNLPETPRVDEGVISGSIAYSEEPGVQDAEVDSLYTNEYIDRAEEK